MKIYFSTTLKIAFLCLFFSITTSLLAQTEYFVSNIAGSGELTFVEDAVALQTGLYKPTAMANGANGDIYFIITASSNPSVAGIYKLNGAYTKVTKELGNLSGISGIAVDKFGKIYYSMGPSSVETDTVTREYIYRFDPSSGIGDTIAGNGLDGSPPDGDDPVFAKNKPIGDADGLTIGPGPIAGIEYLYYTAPYYGPGTISKNLIQRIDLDEMKTERVFGAFNDGNLPNPDLASWITDIDNGDLALGIYSRLNIGLAFDKLGHIYFATAYGEIKKIKYNGAGAGEVFHFMGTGTEGYNGNDHTAGETKIHLERNGFFIVEGMGSGNDVMYLCEKGNNIIRTVSFNPADNDANGVVELYGGTGYKNGDNADGIDLGLYASEPILNTNIQPSNILQVGEDEFVFTDFATNQLRLVTDCQKASIKDVVLSDPTVCQGEAVKLKIIGELNDAIEWDWYKGENNCLEFDHILAEHGASLNIIANQNDYYYVIGKGGCSHQTSCFEIKLDLNCGNFNNVFTPNDDGKNEFFNIAIAEKYPQNIVRIYNRWGNLVTEIKNYDNESEVWRGLNQENEKMDSGTYYFILEANEELILSGWVELIR